VLYNFSGGSDGANPRAGLYRDQSGALFGTAQSGGDYDAGTVYRFEPGSRQLIVLYSFTGGSDGGTPQSVLIADANGSLYGTTIDGGIDNCYGYCGTVFSLAPSGGTWTENVIYAFRSTSDGDHPEAALVMDANGTLYGTTYTGGDSGHTIGLGTVYALSQSGGAWSEALLHVFTGEDGASPTGALIMDKKGALFGTTSWAPGGSFGYGTVFKIVP